MEIDTHSILRRLIGYATVALIATAGFAAVWVASGVSRAFQGAVTIAAAVLFVVALHEVACCRGLLREMRRESGHDA